MPNLLNSTVFNYFLHIGQFSLQTGADISKWGKCITKQFRYYKVGQGDVGQSRSIKELGKSYFTEWQVIYYEKGLSLLQIGAGATKCGSFITKYVSLYKVVHYIDQKYMKELARKVCCQPLFFSFEPTCCKDKWRHQCQRNTSNLEK